MKELVEKYNELQRVEILAEDYYQSLMMPYIKSTATRSFIQDMAIEYLEQLKPFVHKYSAYWLQFYYYKIAIMKFLSINNYKGTILFCKEAIQYFTTRPYEVKGAIARIQRC